MENVRFIARSEQCDDVGADMFAWLAFPRARDAARRRRRAHMFRGALVHLLGEHQAGFSPNPDQLNALETYRRARAGNAHFESALRRRSAAGAITIAQLADAGGLPVGLPSGLTSLTFASVLQWLADEEGFQLRNVERRIFDESKPVLSLAAAYALLVQERQRRGSIGLGIYDLALDPNFLWRWVEGANALAPDIEAHWAKRKDIAQPRYSIDFANAQNTTVVA